MAVNPVPALLAVIMLLGVPAPQASPTRYAGTTIVVGVMDAPAIGSPAVRHARTWEAATGGKVVIRKFPYADLFERLRRGIEADPPEFDVIFYNPAWIGDIHSHLGPLPAEHANSPTFDDVHETYRERLMTWADRWLAVTVDGDLFSGYYRKDLFEDEANRREFRARYGYTLGPPTTWKAYRDAAEFFTGRSDSNGRKVYGTAEAFARGGQQFWTLFSRVSAYVNHPEHRGWQFFNPDTMEPSVNNPAWTRALEDYIDILQFCAPDARSFDIIRTREEFVEGRAAMALDWGDTAQLSADPEASKVVGRVGYFVLPGAREVWNAVENEWQTFDPPSRAPFLAFGGWVASVPRASRNQDAAWDYVMWYSNPENSMTDVVTSGSGINPYRYSHFVSIDRWTSLLSRQSATEFLTVLKDSLDDPNVALDLRLPGYSRYTDALEEQLTSALHGRIGAQSALDRVAQSWRRITSDLQWERQRMLYRTSMGLAN